ncbi:MAG TPA: hypothetical protein DEB43_06225 [Desulfovibrio sp.]|nr:hypothetical protein [Desulfovibrio sp.]
MRTHFLHARISACNVKNSTFFFGLCFYFHIAICLIDILRSYAIAMDMVSYASSKSFIEKLYK